MRILIVDDDVQTTETLKNVLDDFYITEICHTGKLGEDQALVQPYDLIILDYLLPDKSGLEVCKSLRQNNIKTPILMLTGRGEVDDKVLALDSGVDDYLTKPVHYKELLARVRALLRRPIDSLNNILTIGDLTIDISKGTVSRGEREIFLRKKELYLLEYLARNVGRIITREMITDHVWKSFEEPLTNTIDVHMKHLRDRIDKQFDKKLIKTIYGLGYKIEI